VRCLFVFLVCRFMPEVIYLFIFMIPIICRLTMSKQAASILKYGYIVPQTCFSENTYHTALRYTYHVHLITLYILTSFTKVQTETTQIRT